MVEPPPPDGPVLPVGADMGTAASKTVLGRGLLYTVATAAPVLSNAVVTPFVTRLLSPTDYGVVATALVVIQVGMILAGLGLAAAITRHGILEESGVEGARALVLRGALAAAAVAATVALMAEPLGDVLHVGSADALILSAVAAAGFSVVVNAQAYLRVLDRPLPFVLLSLGAALGGPVLGLAVLLTAPSPSARGFLTGLTAGYVLTGLVGLGLTVRGGHHHRGDTRRALRVGLPTVPHQMAIYLASGVLVLVAARLYGSAEAGRLQLAVLIGSAPGVITSSLNNAWAPVVYRSAAADRGVVLERTGRDIAAVTALGAGFVALTAPTLLAVVAPPAYDPREMTPAVGLVAIGSVMSVLYLANVHLVFASGRSWGLAFVTPAALLLGTAAAWAAGSVWGPSAIGVGMAVTYASMAAGVAVLARRVSETRWAQTRLAAPLAAGVLVCLVGAVIPVSGAWLAGRWVLSGALLVLSGMVLRRVLTR